MKFILNKTSGINQIENILLEKILKTFSFPENIEINIEKDNILDILCNKLKKSSKSYDTFYCKEIISH